MSIFGELEGLEDYEIDEVEPSAEETNKQLVNKLIDRAKANNHSSFEFVRNLNEYTATKTFKNAVQKIATRFIKSANNLFKSYFKDLKEGISKLDLFLAAKEMMNISEFYMGEVAIAEDMLSEYRSYLGAGHALDAFMGIYRPESDLHDFRILNAK